ncbi:GroES-like protein [Auriscalpium vulgare]|uniref:GroES-like protein n=1 Tax=Auriscalpium vulgare TaxID=40419 RepID=A0ACB8RAW5_9AGAM|nr:GroES-like protein [Auriscalpium vulgare]
MAPIKQQASVVGENGTAVLAEVDVPKLGPGQILVKVVAAAQNPSDWKAAQSITAHGATIGLDYAGIVEEIGSDVPAGVRYLGEKVCGFVRGAAGAHGAFAEYLVASAQYATIPIPNGWSFEDAAQIGVAAFTTVQAMTESLTDLPTPLAPATTPTPLLVYGGSSSVGFYTIQWAKLAGLHVIATASKHNHDILKRYGADEVYDYRDPDVGAKIRAATQGRLRHAVDTISEAQSPRIVSEALSEEGGTVAQILRYDSPRPGVEVKFSLAYYFLGQDMVGKYVIKATPETRANSIKQGKLLSDILALGKIRPMPTLIFPKGLASVQEGFEFMKAGKVSGQKITYRIADTPGLKA